MRKARRLAAAAAAPRRQYDYGRGRPGDTRAFLALKILTSFLILKLEKFLNVNRNEFSLRRVGVGVFLLLLFLILFGPNQIGFFSPASKKSPFYIESKSGASFHEDKIVESDKGILSRDRVTQFQNV